MVACFTGHQRANGRWYDECRHQGRGKACGRLSGLAKNLGPTSNFNLSRQLWDAINPALAMKSQVQ
jgi:hypothetical protein